MASMLEIYQRHCVEYDRLVEAEDHLHSLPAFLHALIDWNGQTVLEGGTGTGRVTEWIAPHAREMICLEREPHMLEAAKERLAGFSEKITCHVADNLALPMLPTQATVYIQGWSWGHSIVDGPRSVEDTTALLFDQIRKNLAGNATVILIETLGTNQAEPAPPLPRLGEFYHLLETRYGMKKTILSTDYQFATVQQAADTLGFFFGEEMKQNILKANSPLIPEWTGVWQGHVPA